MSRKKFLTLGQAFTLGYHGFSMNLILLLFIHFLNYSLNINYAADINMATEQ